MKSKNWLQRNYKDIYVKKAKEAGYLSRAAYKLIDIENKYQLIRKSNNLLEIGSSPGSWTQIIYEKNKTLKVTAFDLIDMKFKNENLNFIQEDIFQFNFNILKEKYDLILSDIAPNTSGHKNIDHLRIISMITKIIDNLHLLLIPNGNFVFKIWKGSEEKDLLILLNNHFNKIEYFKPKSSRKDSSEIYIVALQYIEKK